MSYIAELRVAIRAIGKGMLVSRPLGDSCRYDLVLDDGDRLWRIQVKQSEFEVKPGVYQVNLRSGVVPYGS